MRMYIFILQLRYFCCSNFTIVCIQMLRHKKCFMFLFTETHRTVLSLISCFAGGVFLAACLLDIIPDYLSDINAELDARGVEVCSSMD